MLFILCASLLLIVPSSSAANIDCADGTDGADVITCASNTDIFGQIDTGLGDDHVYITGTTVLHAPTDLYAIYNAGGTLEVVMDQDSDLFTGTIAGIYSDGDLTLRVSDGVIIACCSPYLLRVPTASVNLTFEGTALINLANLFFGTRPTGDDVVTIRDTARINSFINLEGGDDHVIIEGQPIITNPIMGADGFDTLEFKVDSVAERDALNVVLATKDVTNDSIIFNGRTIRWQWFDRLIATYTPPSSEGVETSPAILDNRINRTIWDVAAPVAVYQNADVIDVYAINPNTDIGTLLIRLNISDLRDTQVDDDPIALGSAIIPSTGREVSVFLLPSGELQLNSTYYDLTEWKPYVIVWRLDSPDELYHLVP